MNNRVKAIILVWAISYMLTTLTVYTVIFSINSFFPFFLLNQFTTLKAEATI